jgi:tetratricopeptide (TPR) repeat protein
MGTIGMETATQERQREALAEAQRWQQAGDLSRAEQAYRAILRENPGLFEGWYLLGTILSAVGRLDEAAASHREAIRLWPDFPEGHNSLGIALIRQGDRAAAEASFRRAVALRPGFAQALNNLGNVLKEQDRNADALACYEQAVRAKPDMAEAHNNLGNLLREQGRFQESAAACREAIRLKPAYPEAHNNLGGALAGLKKFAEAIPCYQEALRLLPEMPEALNNLGGALSELGRLEEAADCLRRSRRLQPGNLDAIKALANVLREMGQAEEAVALAREAVRLRPDDPGAHGCLGLTLGELGQHVEALACHEEALRLAPDRAETRRNRALVWLLLGDYERGWPEFEARWGTKELPHRNFPRPAWDGSPLKGRTILLHAEQGFGDTLQFIRYAPLVRERGGRVVVACQRPLRRVLEGCPGIDWLVVQGDPIPPFDVHAPLLSLPRLFGTTVATIPANVPYLAADPDLVERWRRELEPVEGFKIGITWGGSVAYRRDRMRSAPLARFAPLAELPGVQLVSLQKGPARDQIRQVASRWPLLDLGDRLDEVSGAFMDTAALIKNLDLVVTVDSAVAHLAGALAAPVWIATSFVPDWRRLLDREDDPWYPTARLFRQKRAGDWDEVFQRIAQALRPKLARPGALRPIHVEIAPGELLDKLLILEIKAERLRDPAKLRNVHAELAALTAVRARCVPDWPELHPLIAELKTVNVALWEVEDELRLCERAGEFGPQFIELARSVYRNNDRRAALKRTLNERLGSTLIEEKGYRAYETPA